MKKLSFWILPLMSLGFAGGILGDTSYMQNDQLRKDIDSRLADMRQAEAALDAAQADLTSAKRDKAALEKQTYDYDVMRVLRARIDKDRSDVQTYTTRLLDDITFLQSQWSVLSETERDTVKRASESLE